MTSTVTRAPDGSQLHTDERPRVSGGVRLAAARATEGLLGRLPEGAGRALGTALGTLAHRPLGIRRGVVMRQVAAAFPERDAVWVEAVVRGCYRHFGRELTLLPGLRRAGPDALRARTAGREEVREVFRAHGVPGRGAVVVTGHVGNWELAGAVLAGFGLRVFAAYRPPDPPFDGWVAELRRGLGVEPVPESRAPLRLLRALREGGVVALVADQHAGPRGAVVTFLGRQASTWRGPSRLALRADVPLFFGALLREGAGYRARLEPVPRPAAPDAGDGGDGWSGTAEGDDAALTGRWVRRLEAAVRERPEQYFWFHRRWKTAERRERIEDRRRNEPPEGR